MYYDEIRHEWIGFGCHPIGLDIKLSNQPERLNPEDAKSVCDSPTPDNK